MNQSYQLHDETAKRLYDAVQVLLQYENGNPPENEATEEWKEDLDAAAETLVAQNPDLDYSRNN